MAGWHEKGEMGGCHNVNTTQSSEPRCVLCEEGSQEGVTFSVTHQNSLCLSLMSIKHGEYISSLIKQNNPNKVPK